MRYKQFLIYSLVSLAGMLISHYVPEDLFFYWVGLSLLIGHLVNLKNYK